MADTDPRIERLALAVALTQHMIQCGCSVGLLQQQAVNLRGAVQDVINAEDLSHDTHVQITQPIPESLAEELASDFVVPDDASEAEDP
jgi:hypothetical protein